MTEIWKPIPNLDGYEASTHGNVRSVDRVVSRDHPGIGIVMQPLKGKTLRPVHCKNGYLYVVIRGRSIQVHRLVALAWVDVYQTGFDASHSDGVRTNNSFENLSWKSRKDNLHDQISHGTRLRGETQNGAKLTGEIVLKMREQRIVGGERWSTIARKYGVTPSAAKSAIIGKTWAHIKDQPSRPVAAIMEPCK